MAGLVDENGAGRILFACGQTHGDEASDLVKTTAARFDAAFQFAMGILDQKRAAADAAAKTKRSSK